MAVRCSTGCCRENTRISQLIGAPSLLNAPITASAPAHILRRARICEVGITVSEQRVQLGAAKHVHSCARRASRLHLVQAASGTSCILYKLHLVRAASAFSATCSHTGEKPCLVGRALHIAHNSNSLPLKPGSQITLRNLDNGGS